MGTVTPVQSYRSDMSSITITTMGGFRCSLGEWACTASCVTLGQTSGICDSEGDCNCSEKSISLKNFKKLLPSRCNLGQSFCEVTCNSIGRKTGTCGTTDSPATQLSGVTIFYFLLIPISLSKRIGLQQCFQEYS